jgi:hypothetical protein
VVPGTSTYYVRAQWTTRGITDVALNLNPPAKASINFKVGTSLRPGTYSDQVGLEICADQACNQPFAGTAVTIPTTYTVTPATQQPTISIQQSSVSFQALSIDPFQQPAVTIPFTLANFVQSPYLSMASSNTAVANGSAMVTNATQGTLTIGVPSGQSLGAGTYTATISITACLDSTCVNPVQGSPFEVTVNYTVGNSVTVSGPNGYTVQAMQQKVESMVWDNVHQLLYVVLPFGTSGVSQVAAIDPTTLTMTAQVDLDAAANGAVALSDDSQFIYVGLVNGTVQRLSLPQLTTDLRVHLNTGSVNGLYAGGLAVAPGAPHTLAVALANDPYNPSGSERGVAIFDDDVMRPNEAAASGSPPTGIVADYVQWSSGTSLFGAAYSNSEYSSSSSAQTSLFAMSVDATGITASANAGSVSGGRLRYAQNLLFMDGGSIFNPQTGQIDNSLLSTPYLAGLLPDTTSGRLFVSNSTQVSGTIQLQSLDLQQRTPIATILLPPLASQQMDWALWGQNGIVISTANDLILVSGSFVR